MSHNTILKPEDYLVDPVEASQLLRVSKQSLAEWRCTKRQCIPYVKIGSKVFYKRSDLEAFITKNTVGGEPIASAI